MTFCGNSGESEAVMRSHNPTVPDAQLVPDSIPTATNAAYARIVSTSRELAARMVGVAEMGGIRATYERLLHEHRNQAGICASSSHNTVIRPWGPCDIFNLAAANLELLEILDGSRFTSDWPGPVRERRW